MLRAETFGWLLAQILEVHEGVAGFDKGLWRRAATEADDMLSLLAQPARLRARATVRYLGLGLGLFRVRARVT